MAVWNFMESFLVHWKRNWSLLFLDFQGLITQGSRSNTQNWSSEAGHPKRPQALGQIGHFLNNLLLFGGLEPETSGQRNFRPETAAEPRQDSISSISSAAGSVCRAFPRVFKHCGKSQGWDSRGQKFDCFGGTVWEHFVLQLLWTMNPLGTESLLSFLGRDGRGI